MAIGTYISIIALNIHGLSVPTKRSRPAEWIHKQDWEGGQSQGGRGIGLGDHILPDNFIKRSSKH